MTRLPLTRGLCLAALGVVGWSAVVEPNLFTLRRYALPVLPEDATPVRVLQLSDLHLAPWQHRKIDWVRRLAELRPDLLVLTGDLLGHREATAPLMHALQPFADAGVPGVFVHGSNDYYGPILKNPLKYLREPSRLSTRQMDIDNEALTRGLTSLGFENLNNNAARITLRGTTFDMLGLGDPHIRYDDVAQLDAGIAALPGWRKKQKPVRLGVVHAPYQQALNQLLDREASLIFAGHTHGGQVRLPGFGALTSNCDLPVQQARGMSVWYDAHHTAFLHVSAGLGASIYSPVRFACRPEASIIALEASNES